MLRYRLEIADLHAHLWRVRLTVPAPAAAQGLAFATWAPGSYTRRDFARHVSGLAARQRGQAVALQRDGLSRWVARCREGVALEVEYLVYAFDPSVRGSFLDDARGFVNGPAVFVRAEGHEALPHALALGRLPRGWQVAGTMPPVAADWAEFIDHPLAMGPLWRGTFSACGVPHGFTVLGAWPGFDGERLLADAQRICEAHIRFWHGRGKPPFAHYEFLLHLRDDDYGGLEHRASTALVAARRDLPRRGGAERPDGYVNLLALVSHEYFHAWNVVRMKPPEFSAPDLQADLPTPLLWFYEGFTSYYDELMLLRAGLVDRARYLRQLSRPVNNLLATPGRQVQSVADASFDAWTKYYRRDENTANATVSYYDKGALVALCTDLALRREGGTLDEVMRALWRRRGPVGADEVFAALPPAVAQVLHGWVHGTGELPLAELLPRFGIALRPETPTLAAAWGLKLSEGALTGVQVRHVLRGSAAEAAGLAAGDEILAADGWRLRRLEDLRQWVDGGAACTLTIVRDQRLRDLSLRPPASPAAPAVLLADDPQAPPAALALRRAWLGG